MGAFETEHVRQLLHNKYVAVLGDSIQRSVYKDLVKFLRNDMYLTEKQLKCKGEKTFEQDFLVEGGTLQEMHNGVTYREVRQYRTDHHLLRFYFLTRAYSLYLESILSDFQEGLQPDVLIINSCFWDITRYKNTFKDYKVNLDNLFSRLKVVLNPDCLVIWSMTMPLGNRDQTQPERSRASIRQDIIEGNFYGATIADLYNVDVVDMHYHFRFDLSHRCRDSIHWNQLAHRKHTQILLSHIAHAWGVEVPQKKGTLGPIQAPGQSRVVTWRHGNVNPLVRQRNQGNVNHHWEKPSLLGSPELNQISQNVREPALIPINPGNCGVPDHWNYPNKEAPPGFRDPFNHLNTVPHPPFTNVAVNLTRYTPFEDRYQCSMRRSVKRRDGRVHPYYLEGYFPSRI
ncbi:hypothetical protein GDO86_000033 [Hymenochirus boettgeri]|uniref:Family with sequence similarity 113 n=1 Tax=Hymenochirus boettgeri TaxID=247094 RepID=A0A8T2KCX1_9PIPI|nr:hypothetical protein GDO86_000033 [Hymenochirus boettgeri]